MKICSENCFNIHAFITLYKSFFFLASQQLFILPLHHPKEVLAKSPNTKRKKALFEFSDIQPSELQNSRHASKSNRSFGGIVIRNWRRCALYTRRYSALIPLRAAFIASIFKMGSPLNRRTFAKSSSAARRPNSSKLRSKSFSCIPLLLTLQKRRAFILVFFLEPFFVGSEGF